MKIVGVGNSHIQCIRLALTRAERRLLDLGVQIEVVLMNEPHFRPLLQTDASRELKLNSTLRNEICSKSRDADLVFSCIGGNAHNVFGLARHPNLYDFVLPSNPQLDLLEGAQIIPSALVSQAVEQSGPYKLTRKCLEEVRGIVSGDLVHCESPPPIQDEDHLRSYAATFREQFEATGVSSATFRHKLWRIHSELVSLDCQRIGMAFLPCPSETLEPNGFLGQKAWGKDPTHANRWYGERVVEQIIRLRDPTFRFPEAA